jgi:hypothetical protein
VLDAQRNGQRGGCFKAYVKAEHRSRRDIDRKRQPGAADRAAMFRVHNHHIGERVIDLHKLKRLGGFQHAGGRQCDRLGRFGAHPPARDQTSIECANAVEYGVSGRGQISSALWQATQLSPTVRGTGICVSQRDITYGQRVRNTQPEGGARGEGISPLSGADRRARARTGSAMGTDCSSARV